jgi:hypothetical protein
MIPQGSHEMTAIAQVCADPELDYTIFRVPFLSSGGEELRVYAGMIDPEYKGSTGLSRGSMVKWVYEEIDKREWVGNQPAVGN